MDASRRERMLLAGVRVLVGGAAVVLSGVRASRWCKVHANVWLHSTRCTGCIRSPQPPPGVFSSASCTQAPSQSKLPPIC